MSRNYLKISERVPKEELGKLAIIQALEELGNEVDDCFIYHHTRDEEVEVIPEKEFDSLDLVDLEYICEHYYNVKKDLEESK